MQSHNEYSEITNQTLHNFFVNSLNVSAMNFSCRDNPMDWDLANSVAIRFYPRDAMLARVFAIAMCLSGRLSVTRRYCA